MKIIFFRLLLVTILIYSIGVEVDMRWHTVFPTRPDYFILPHTIIYFGILSTLLCFLVLKFLGEKINYLVFLLFPLLSIFDEIWHRVYGIELYTSPMMFWSPAHFSFGLVIIYLWVTILKLKVDDNPYVRVLMQTFLLVAIWRFFRYILIPVSPFSYYTSLHTDFNILVPVFLYLLLLFFSQFVTNKNIIILSGFFLTYISISAHNFIAGNSYIYGGPLILLLSFVPFIYFGVFKLHSVWTYIFYGQYLVILIYVVQSFVIKSINISGFAFSSLITFSFSVLMFYIFGYMYKFLENKKLSQSLRELFV